MSLFAKKDEAKKAPGGAPHTDLGRNDPCHCGSGKKYKKCCADKDAAAEHSTLEKQWQSAEKDAAKKAEEEKAEAAKNPPVNPSHKPVQKTVTGPKHNTIATPKFNAPRRTGGG